MATRMNPLAGRYFNDPSFAAGMSNLAQAFAPPGPEDYIAAEQVKGLRTQNTALADLMAGANGNLDVLGGVAAGGWTPNQGFEAVRGGLANERYNIDTDAATALRTNAADNARALEAERVRGLFGMGSTPLNYDQAMPGLPDDVAAAIGVPAFPSQSGAALGAPAPALSESQVRGNLISGADLSNDDIYALAMGTTPTESIVGADGRPVQAFGALAARDGAQPFVNPGSQAAPTMLTYEGADGIRRGAIAQGGQYLDTTGRPLTPEESGTVAEVGKPMGSNDQLGITNSNRTRAQSIEAAAAKTDLIVTDIESLIDAQAGAAGAAGVLQRIGQDLVQTSREIGAAMTANGVDGIVTPEMLDGLQNRVSPGDYNPVFQQIRTYLLTLAYANAELKNGGNEVSQNALQRELEALGQGALGNDESLKAALSVSRQGARIALEEAKVLRGGSAAQIPTIADVNAGAPPAPSAVQPGDEDLFLKYGLTP